MKLAEFVTPKLQRTALTAEQERGLVKVTLHINGTPTQRATNAHNATKLLN
ncbi:hypothetical protein HHL22_09585 [Hymenobacter sp. RP-2-7]|uniref:Uncharacterized protein n=1 Tax=Hymenobacter polaris TaxID=2682546 RepID=A0A7Y0ADQ7_9BACT|nr:hypothetical protein [Hymenobacter polaris]NML65455.1 hypothetical protein [Hymenobacter polaris]